MRINLLDLDPYYIADNNCITIKAEFERVLSDSSYMVLKGHAKITEKPYSIRG
jgi:hypothetical protein